MTIMATRRNSVATEAAMLTYNRQVDLAESWSICVGSSKDKEEPCHSEYQIYQST